MNACRAFCAAAMVACVSVASATADGDGLEVRRINGGSIAKSGEAIPPEAVRVFAYEGKPKSVRVSETGIGVDYGLTGVLFDRKTGKLLRRWTIADGWPERRPDPGYGHLALRSDWQHGELAKPFLGQPLGAVQHGRGLGGADHDVRQAAGAEGVAAHRPPAARRGRRRW